LLKKNSKFEWTKESDLAFKALKERLIQAPILVPPDFNKLFIIRSDASRSGIGGVIIQKDDNGVEKLIHYVSRALRKAKVNYSVTDLEELQHYIA